jgi:succinate-semialdehyde dehydrogenase/glutarate-semialdehyde dehydrogenase
MELGGSDAYIILDDVDLEEATDLATFGRLQNNGQTCIAAKRFIVHDAIYDVFDLFTKKTAKWVIQLMKRCTTDRWQD